MKTMLFLSVIISVASAADFTKQIWSQGSEHYLFSFHAASNILISENCFNDEISLEKSTCEAAKILKQAKTLSAPKNAGVGGRNPGAIVCKDLLLKKIIVLKDQKNNENAFCSFNDGSMISAIALQSLLKD